MRDRDEMQIAFHELMRAGFTYSEACQELFDTDVE